MPRKSSNPGGTTCSVAACNSNAKWKKKTGECISFHRFPKDPHLRKEWIRRCYRKDTFNPENKRICSKHFHKEDFEDLCRAKIMNVAPKQLKSTAIPSLHLKFTSTSHDRSPKTALSIHTSNIIQRPITKEQEIVSELLESKVPVEQVEPSEVPEVNADEFTQTEMKFESKNQNENVDLCQTKRHVCQYIQSQCDSLKLENQILKKELEKIKNENNILLDKNKRLEMSVLRFQESSENRGKEVLEQIKRNSKLKHIGNDEETDLTIASSDSSNTQPLNRIYVKKMGYI